MFVVGRKSLSWLKIDVLPYKRSLSIIFFAKQDISEPDEPWYWPERPKEIEEEEEEEEEEEDEEEEDGLTVSFLFVCLFGSLS